MVAAPVGEDEEEEEREEAAVTHPPPPPPSLAARAAAQLTRAPPEGVASAAVRASAATGNDGPDVVGAGGTGTVGWAGGGGGGLPGDDDGGRGAAPPPPSRGVGGGGGVVWNTRALDWSASSGYAVAHAAMKEAGAAAAARGGTLHLAGDLDPADALGLWVALWQPGGPGGPARLYVALDPLGPAPPPDAATAGVIPDSLHDFRAEEEEEGMSLPHHHLATPYVPVEPGITFRPSDHPPSGGWRNYRVTLLGGVAAHPEHVLWPNQLLHADRAAHNVRGAADVAAFFAEPDAGGVVSHALNIAALAAYKDRDAAWCWDLLVQRWGRDALAKLGMSPGKAGLFPGVRPARGRARGGGKRRGEEGEE
jgi:hypothetical protein